MGPKLAQRIVAELKDKPIGDGRPPSRRARPACAAGAAGRRPGEAVAALMGLGVAEPAARRAVEQALSGWVKSAERPVIKAALQELGR